MTKTLLLLALLFAGCNGCEPGTILHDSIKVTSVEVLDNCVNHKKYEVRLNNNGFLHTDTLYAVGDTIK